MRVYTAEEMAPEKFLNEQLLVAWKNGTPPVQIKCTGFLGPSKNVEALKGFDTEGMNRTIYLTQIDYIIRL